MGTRARTTQHTTPNESRILELYRACCPEHQDIVELFLTPAVRRCAEHLPVNVVQIARIPR